MRRYVVAVLLIARAAHAQHESHDSAHVALGAQAVASVTRLTNAADGRSRTEGYLSQPVLMGHATVAHAHVGLVATLNFEGLTLDRGELLGGVYGEGYVDRRHPHTLVHEAVASIQGTIRRGVDASLAAGRGFVPFGTDDPMMRPFERYPINHHLAQILERVVVVGAVRVPHAIAEVATFNGDEPTGPFASPRWRRFGDSWSARLTLTPLPRDLELGASTAFVRAPEDPQAGGLDARKWSASARWTSPRAYALAEWARTTWQRDGRTVTVPGYHDESLLAEGSVHALGVDLAARAERTDRPEEERLVDPFRTVRPASDVSTLGVTRWTVLTLGVARPTRAGVVRFSPFAELSSLAPRALVPGAVFDPVSFYGGRHLWAVTAGMRLGAGVTHARMGRYGVAMPVAAARHHMAGMGHMPGKP